MKNRIIYLIIFFANNLFAEPIDSIQAKLIAVNFMQYKAPQKKNFEIEKVIVRKYNEINTTYVANFKEGGYVLVPADNSVVPVLTYNTKQKFDETKLPDAAEDWLLHYDESVYNQKIEKASNKNTIQKWGDIINKKFHTKSDSIGPLLSVKWGQSKSYDGECDAFNYYIENTGGSCNCNYSNKCPAGCVAVAMAQIMKYWAYPVRKGEGFYNWCNMPDTLRFENNTNYTAEKKTIASLLSGIGSLVGMNYCSGGCESGTTDSKARYAFVNYYNYSTKADLKRRILFSDGVWKNMIRNEINNKRPVYYSGVRYEKGHHGHAFICDGYNNINGADYFFFNFGWNGISDGPYYIDNINPKPTPYSHSQQAIIEIYPNPNLPYDCNEIRNLCEKDSYTNYGFYVSGTLLSVSTNECPEWGGSIWPPLQVVYLAYNSIELRQGFRVLPGAKFRAKIIQCPSECGNIYNKNINKSNILNSTTNIEDLYIDEKSINIYPNPAQDVLYIQTEPQENQVETAIYDILGNKVFYKKYSLSSGDIITVNTSSFHSGIYFVKIISDNFVETKKILIQ